MAKIYLSPALHGTDNPTQCPGGGCTENTHCGQYMDIVERRLKALGFEVKRGGPATGLEGMTERVRESNAWGADIHYCAHTNAGGGRYSLTLCWNDALSKARANVIHKYRQSVAVHKIRTTADLYEIRATRATCLYDELIFHDNAEDCAWFHSGGMEKLAEETVQALCEICGVSYAGEAAKPAVSQPAAATASAAGKKLTLVLCPLYVSATATKRAGRKTGIYYLYDGKKVSGRYRITNSKANVGKLGQVTGWIDAKYVK